MPLWPFGHGLSYTTYTYSALSISGTISPSANSAATITMTLTNSGAVAGSEVVQLYVQFPAGLGEPPKALKGFQKVALAAGASTTLTFTLDADDIAIFDLVSDDFVTPPGTYGVALASSSKDIRLTGSVTVTA